MDGGRELEERREKKLQLVCKTNKKCYLNVLKTLFQKNRSFFTFIFLVCIMFIKGKILSDINML